MQSNIILSCKNVSVIYDGKQILRDVSFDITDVILKNKIQGQIVSLIGRSGIGKSVLFKSLSGIHKPTSGEVIYNGNLVKAGEVGIVTQTYTLLNHRTVRGNLSLATKDKELINSYAETFNLKEHLSRYPYQLSGGQRQRVSIVQQVLTGNNLILLDEPFSGLDCLMVDKVLNLLSKVATKNELITLVIVSHDLETSLSISDHVIIMAKQEGLEGATVIKEYDLVAENLCFQPGIREMPRFREIVKEIKTII